MQCRCEQIVDKSFIEMRKAMEEARQFAETCQTYKAIKKLAKAATYAGESAAATALCNIDGGFERGTVYRGLAGEVLRYLKRCLGEGATLSGFRSRARRRSR